MRSGPQSFDIMTLVFRDSFTRTLSHGFVFVFDLFLPKNLVVVCFSCQVLKKRCHSLGSGFERYVIFRVGMGV